MFVVMLRAFIRTRIADIRTKLTNVGAELRSAAHEGRGRPAHVSAIAIEANAIGHRLDVGFPKTGLTAVPASLRAPGTGIDT